MVNGRSVDLKVMASYGGIRIGCSCNEGGRLTNLYTVVKKLNKTSGVDDASHDIANTPSRSRVRYLRAIAANAAIIAMITNASRAGPTGVAMEICVPTADPHRNAPDPGEK